MKKFALTLLAALSLASLVGAGSTFAHDSGMYFKALGGGTFLGQQFWQNPAGSGAYYNMDSGLNVGAAIGWYANPNIAVEAEGFYTHQTYSGYSNSLSSTSLMVNGLYHANPAGTFDPFFGVGVGAVNLSYAATSNPWSGSGWALGGQAIAGAAFALSDNLSLLGEARYQVSGNATDPSNVVMGYNGLSASLGLEIKF